MPFRYKALEPHAIRMAVGTSLGHQNRGSQQARHVGQVGHVGQKRGKSGANALAGQMRGKCGRSGAQVRHTEQILIIANATYSLRHLNYWASCGRAQRCFHGFMLPLQLCSLSRSQKLVLLKASDKTCRHTCRPSPIWRSSIGPRAWKACPPSPMWCSSIGPRAWSMTDF